MANVYSFIVPTNRTTNKTKANLWALKLSISRFNPPGLNNLDWIPLAMINGSKEEKTIPTACNPENNERSGWYRDVFH